MESVWKGKKMEKATIVKVILTLMVKPETKNEFFGFLHKNVPNVRTFEGCRSVKLYFDDATNEMIISEDWMSKEDHGKYIKFISENGVMEGLVSFLHNVPAIKYYDTLNI
jgi:quinol monooxygenase YgiN